MKMIKFGLALFWVTLIAGSAFAQNVGKLRNYLEKNKLESVAASLESTFPMLFGEVMLPILEHKNSMIF